MCVVTFIYVDNQISDVFPLNVAHDVRAVAPIFYAQMKALFL